MSERSAPVEPSANGKALLEVLSRWRRCTAIDDTFAEQCSQRTTLPPQVWMATCAEIDEIETRLISQALKDAFVALDAR